MSDHWHKTSRGGQAPRPRDPFWPTLVGPLIVLLLLLGLTIYATFYQLGEERAEAMEHAELVQTLLAKRIERLIDDTLRPLRRLQLDWTNQIPQDQAGFEQQIGQMIKLVPQIRMVALVTRQHPLVASWAREPTGTPTRFEDLGVELTFSDEPVNLEPVVATPSGEQGPPDVLTVVVPLGAESSPQTGAIVASISVEKLLEGILERRLLHRFNLVLRDGSRQTRFSLGAEPAPWALAKSLDQSVRVLDLRWSLRVIPSAGWSRGLIIRKPVWMMLVGGAISMLASGAALQAVLYRRRERHRTRQQFAALESLNQISAALTDTPEAGLEILSLLASDVKRLLHMPMVCIFLLDAKERTIRLAYYAGVRPPVRSVFAFDELPGAHQCLEQGKVMIVSDLHTDPGPFNLDQIRDYSVRAIVLLPMVVNGKPLGVIGLSDTNVRQFSEMEVRMARLWGAQAGVILAQSTLYQQLRQQVQTNEILLRELNHRVKNNLTGILGMLEIGRPPLGADAQRWLDRVAARVETMARTHELFVGGLRAVGMEDLVDKTLATIRAIQPRGVRIQIDMKQLKAPVPVERAITLAIVLNELCYNSIVHGVRDGGTLTVRGRTTESGLAAIEVEDRPSNGHTAAPASPPESSTGIGITLVRALVGRELRGTLHVDPAPGGGTLATIEFPLDVRASDGEHP